MIQETPRDLEWLAFRYVAAELPDDERRWFEEVLAEDQAAREAVARAVELTISVDGSLRGPSVTSSPQHMAHPVTLPPRRPVRSAPLRRATWLPYAITACLLLTVAFLALRPAGNRRLPTPAPDSTDSTSELAHVWSQARAELLPEPGGELLLAEAKLSEPVANDDPDDKELVTPDWMFAAVSYYEDLKQKPFPQ
jgi:hypothetical protein